jgi:hypothetical protein
MGTLPLKRFRVTVIEWLAHDAVVEAADAQAAEAEARRLWAENAEHQVFSFDDSGISASTAVAAASAALARAM